MTSTPTPYPRILHTLSRSQAPEGSHIEKNLQAYDSDTYAVGLYKNNTIGVRRKSGDKKQIFSFGAGKGLNEKELRSWADQVLKKLDDGMSPMATKTWIDMRLG